MELGTAFVQSSCDEVTRYLVEHPAMQPLVPDEATLADFAETHCKMLLSAFFEDPDETVSLFDDIAEYDFLMGIRSAEDIRKLTF